MSTTHMVIFHHHHSTCLHLQRFLIKQGLLRTSVGNEMTNGKVLPSLSHKCWRSWEPQGWARQREAQERRPLPHSVLADTVMHMHRQWHESVLLPQCPDASAGWAIVRLALSIQNCLVPSLQAISGSHFTVKDRVYCQINGKNTESIAAIVHNAECS